ncbi:MAG: sel1 repeat family protein [Pseudomonadota bacterium]|nr:sel1 repeat family protein [Pseudomonadota bacterium]
MRSPSVASLIACLAVLTALPAQVQAQADPTNNSTMVAAGFLEGHPDLLYREQGLNAYGERQHTKAMERFKMAAHFGDKASQAIVGEMLWSGVGVEQDRVMALVWMDLAAERNYPRFVNTRNGYWNALTPGERQRARNLVDNLYAEYGDAVAEPRLARALRRARNSLTGSRVGSQTSNVQIVVPGQGSIDASQFYNPKYWDPKQYRAWHDNFWQNAREGKVDVGDPEKLDAIKTGPKTTPGTRKP